jgi:hydrogenase expression/formation protein HypC
MCLAVPARIVERRGDAAVVDLGGVRRGASLVLTPEAREGDWILLHAGYAIQTVDEAAAGEALALRAAGLDVIAETADPESVA